MPTSSPPLPRVPPTRHLTRDHPPMEVKGVVAVSWNSWNLVPASRATTAICLGLPYLYHLSFVQAERQLLVLFVIIVCAVAPREARHGTRRPDRVASPCTRVKVLA